MQGKRETWAPILNAVEGPPGRWIMKDAFEQPIGEIRIIRAGGEVGYKAKYKGELVGHFKTLNASCNAVYNTHIDVGARKGPPNGRPSEPRP